MAIFDVVSVRKVKNKKDISKTRVVGAVRMPDIGGKD